MTMFSCSLLVVEPIADLRTLESPALPNTQQARLIGLPDRFGPGEISPWAKRRGINVYYVDNCWVRVPITPDELGALLQELAATCPDLVAFSQPDFQQMLILDADEF